MRSEFSLREIGSHLKLNDESSALVEKNADFPIKGIANIHQATKNELTFVSNATYIPAIESSKAKIFIISKDLVRAIPAAWNEDRIFLVVPDSKVSLARISSLFFSDKKTKVEIHPTAIIDESVSLGKSVSIGAYAVIGANSKILDFAAIGDGCKIGENVVIGSHSQLFANVVIYDNCEIGNSVRIHANSVIGADGFGYAQEKTINGVEHVKIQHMGKVKISNNVEIGACTTIDRGTLGDTTIGAGTKIDNQVQIGHNCEIGEAVIICGKTGLSGSVKVAKGVIIAGFSGVGNGVEIGEGAIIGGMTGVQGNVPPATVWAGIPARLKQEQYKIQGSMQYLPEMAKEFRKNKRSKNPENTNE